MKLLWLCLLTAVLAAAAGNRAETNGQGPAGVPSTANDSLHNGRYTLAPASDGSVSVRVEGLPEQTLTPQFTVMRSVSDPGYYRNFNHPDYLTAPRTAVRWSNYPPKEAASKRQPHLRGTSNPFLAGERTDLQARAAALRQGAICWDFDDQPAFALRAQVRLPGGNAEAEISFQLIAKSPGYYSVAFTGAPEMEIGRLVAVPQECAARGYRQFNYLMSETDLKLPRIHLADGRINSVLVVDPKESPFRLPDASSSRFGMMLQEAGGRLRPVALSPILGGPESKMAAGQGYQFTLRYVLRPGDWKDTYRYVARQIYGFRDLRDNSGPGPLNRTLENVIDYLADRNGRNFAMWDAQQKYYDYWTDKSGVLKPFSPLFGLGAAVVTDDEDFYRRRALPAVEFALSRTSNVFSPYDVFDNRQVKSHHRELGAPYLSAAQLVSLWEMFQKRTFALQACAERKTFSSAALADCLARYRLGGDGQHLEAAVRAADAAVRSKRFDGDSYMDFLEMFELTAHSRYLQAAVEGAYRQAAGMNLFPQVPDATLTVDRGDQAPIHWHSFGRHRLWGLPPPRPFPAPQQHVPAWRVSLIGIPSIAYRGEFWMNHHAQFLRLAFFSGDDFLRDLARWGMVGRFGNYPGDNRSQQSLVIERPDLPEHPIWELNFATINPGHAWEFAGEVLDFLVSDAFHRSRGAIDFPSESMQGSSFRVKVYGARPGRFYDDRQVRLWLPRQLATLDNQQIDYLAGYGQQKFYLALWNQSFAEEAVSVVLSENLVDCRGLHPARVWLQNRPQGAASVTDNRLQCKIPAKGIIAYAIDNVRVKTALQAKMTDPFAITLGPGSFVRCQAPFGNVYGMLLSMGRGLSSAFVYADALPENVISARLKYRQGSGPWQELADEVFPYEFSTGVQEDGGDFQCLLEIQSAREEIERSGMITLKLQDQ
jgi:hypothetical protein